MPEPPYQRQAKSTGSALTKVSLDFNVTLMQHWNRTEEDVQMKKNLKPTKRSHIPQEVLILRTIGGYDK